MASERASEQALFGVSALLFAASAAATIVWCSRIRASRRRTSPFPGHAIVRLHRDRLSLRYQPPPTIQKIGGHAVAAGDHRDALSSASVSSTILSFSSVDQRRRCVGRHRFLVEIDSFG
jgi:hypothetical protein